MDALPRVQEEQRRCVALWHLAKSLNHLCPWCAEKVWVSINLAIGGFILDKMGRASETSSPGSTRFINETAEHAGRLVGGIAHRRDATVLEVKERLADYFGLTERPWQG